MFPFINIFGKDISSYSVCAIIGGVVMIIFCSLMCRFPRKRSGVKIDTQDIVIMLLFCTLGLIIGAKLLFIITSVDFDYFEEISFWENVWLWIQLIVRGGLVFYGGLIGAVLGGLFYVLHYKTAVSEMLDLVFAGIPLFHAFGRLGCFLGGCCYGMEYNGIFAVVYPQKNLGGAPVGVELFPVQVAESVLNLILWAVLFAVYRKTSRRWLVSGLYLTCYAVIRFVLEYFRGDIIRGNVGTLSSSQFISIFVLAVGIFLLIRPKFLDDFGAVNDAAYEKQLSALNIRREEYKKAKKARREYRKQYIKEYKEYLKAKKVGKN